jgi:hypothetical protein
MIDLKQTREELEELAATATHIGNLGQHFISQAGSQFWHRKAQFLLGLADVLETLGTEELTLTNLQAAAERALIPPATSAS